MYKADEDTQRMIDWAAAAGLPPLHSLSPEAARAQSAAGTAKTALDLETVAKVENFDFDANICYCLAHLKILTSMGAVEPYQLGFTTQRNLRKGRSQWFCITTAAAL